MDYRSTDSFGVINNGEYRTGAIAQGTSVDEIFVHTGESVPIPNAKLSVTQYSLLGSTKIPSEKVEIHFQGALTAMGNGKIAVNRSLQLTIGGINGYRLNIPAEQFKRESLPTGTRYTYRANGTEIVMADSGQFSVSINRANLADIQLSNLDYVRLDVDAFHASARLNLNCNKERCLLAK